MSQAALEAYKRNSLETEIFGASPIDLVVLTYERLVHSLNGLREDIQQGVDSSKNSETCISLITEGLESCLDFEAGGDIAKNLSTIYQWAVREIMAARLARDSLKIDEVIRIFEEIGGAWRKTSQEPT